MLRIPAFLFQFLCLSVLSAQEFQTFYYGETEGSDLLAEHLAALPDGGAVLTGRSNIVDSGGYRVLLIRTNGDGVLLWQRTYHQGHGAWVSPSSDGGFVVGGTSERHPFGTDQGLVMKVNASGIEEWTQFLPFGNHSEVTRAKPLASGGVVVCGTVSQPDENGQDVFWASFNSDGAIVAYVVKGGFSIDRVDDIIETQSGNLLMAWSTWHESFLSCFDQNGQLVWEINLFEEYDYSGSQLRMLEDVAGDLWLAGGYEGINSTNYEPQVLHLSSDGNLKHRIPHEETGFGPRELLAGQNGEVFLHLAQYQTVSLIRLKLNNQGTIVGRDSIFLGTIPAENLAFQGENRILVLQSSYYQNNGIDVLPIQKSGNTFSVLASWKFSSGLPYSNEYYETNCRSADGGTFILGRDQIGALFKLGYFVLKTDYNSKELARTQIGDGSGSMGGQIQACPDGGAIVLNPEGKAWKVDANANLMWSKTLEKGLLLADQKNGFVIVRKHNQLKPDNITHLWHYDSNGDLIHEKEVSNAEKGGYIIGGISRLGGGFTLWGRYHEKSDNTLRNWIVYLTEDGEVVSEAVLSSEYPLLSSGLQFIQTSTGGILGASLQYSPGGQSIYLIHVEGHTPIWDYLLKSSPEFVQNTLKSIEEVPCRGFVLAMESQPYQDNAPSIQPTSNKIVLLHHIDEGGNGKDFFLFKPLPQSSSADSTFLPGYTYRQWGYELNGQTQDIYLRSVHFPDTNQVLHPLEHLIIMPNPSGHHICLQYESPSFGLMEVKITDATGREVDRFKSEKTEPVWSFDYRAAYPSGTYFIQIKMGKNERAVQRWVKAM